MSETTAARSGQHAPITPVTQPAARESARRWAIVPLRIRAIEPLGLRTPLARVFRASKYRMDTRRTIITRVLTEEGIVGEAYIARYQVRSGLPASRVGYAAQTRPSPRYAATRPV